LINRWTSIIALTFFYNASGAQSAVAIGVEFPKQYYEITDPKNTFIENQEAHRIYSLRYRYLFRRVISINTGLNYRTLNVPVGIKKSTLASSSIGGCMQIPVVIGYHRNLNLSRFSINLTLGPSFDFFLPKGSKLIMEVRDTTVHDTMTLFTSAVIDRWFGVSIAAGLSLEYRIHSRLYFSAFTTFSKGLIPVITAKVSYKSNQSTFNTLQIYSGTYFSYFGVRLYYAFRGIDNSKLPY
jgi:hypothetical protein